MTIGNFVKLARRCWWCNNPLMAISHDEIKTRDGYTVWVHHVCSKNAQQHERTSINGIISAAISPPIED